MNLPIIYPLRTDQSTYIQFSKSLVDFDASVTNNTACYFSKVVALNLPVWDTNFNIDLSSVGITTTNPNTLFPKAIQYYMENIIRQNIGVNDVEVQEIVELAFWKLINKMGVSTGTNTKNLVTFVNTIATSNFVKTENNNGWCEIVAQIPNKCKLLVPAWRNVASVKSIVVGTNTDTCMFDNGNKEFLFASTQKDVLDFNNITYNETTEQDFSFNVLLLYYKDAYGIDKLHGINFIGDFQDKVSYYDLPTFTQKTNQARTVGYQFKFVQKSVVNNATQTAVYDLQENSHFNLTAQTLGLLNSFLEVEMRNNNII